MITECVEKGRGVLRKLSRIPEEKGHRLHSGSTDSPSTKSPAVYRDVVVDHTDQGGTVVDITVYGGIKGGVLASERVRQHPRHIPDWLPKPIKGAVEVFRDNVLRADVAVARTRTSWRGVLRDANRISGRS